MTARGLSTRDIQTDGQTDGVDRRVVLTHLICLSLLQLHNNYRQLTAG